MKVLSMIMAMVFACATSAVASQQVQLDRPTIQYGALDQGRGFSAFETIEMVRTAQTPERVTFKYALATESDQCVAWDNRQVWRPGYSTVRCQTDRLGRQFCDTIWVPGYYEVERYCRRYGRVRELEEKEIVLDFEDADRLRGEEFEVFAIDFDQRRLGSERVEITGRVLSAAVDYKISTSLFKKRLKFKAR